MKETIKMVVLMLLCVTLGTIATARFGAGKIYDVPDMLKATVMIRTDRGVGTGVVIDRQGGSALVVTAAHVMGKNLTAFVFLNSHLAVPAMLININPATDIAILAIDKLGDHDVKIALFCDDLKAGEQVYSIGAVRGEGPVTTTGYVSDPEAVWGDPEVRIRAGFSHSAITGPGSSGGPVFKRSTVGYCLAGINNSMAVEVIEVVGAGTIEIPSPSLNYAVSVEAIKEELK